MSGFFLFDEFEEKIVAPHACQGFKPWQAWG